jgi:hypothetical protein
LTIASRITAPISENDEAGDAETFVDVGAADAEHAAQPAAQERADDADDDVEQDALLRIRPHDQAASQPTMPAHDQPDNDVHAPTPLFVCDPVADCFGSQGRGPRRQCQQAGVEGGVRDASV